MRFQEAIKRVQELEKENEQLKEVLQVSVKNIKNLHDLGVDNPNVYLTDKMTVWDIYYEKSPEMAPIRKAVNKYNLEVP